MSDYDAYENPLITRYASAEMAAAFSEKKRIGLFRRLWTALAESQRELGLNIGAEQIDELKKRVDDIDFARAAEWEKKTRHDVMAHVHAYGEQAPSARPIIHLGATSCFVTDNADILIYRDALNIIRKKVLNVINNLKKFALKYKGLPTLGFTHLQPAQLTTVGKRASLWLYDLYLDYNDIEALIGGFMLRGVKGTTGTQASFVALFDGDGEKVRELERRVVQKMGLDKVFSVTGQTYSRKFDYKILAALSQIAQSASKFSGDMRLLQHMKEIEEPFEKSQIGSSAMAYKRNPMRSERITSLSRFVISLPQNAAFTAATQWLERTLDDSANRRIVMGQAFLAVDGILEIFLNITENLCVYEKIIKKHIDAELPFMATEEILMECVKAGGDRQELHEKIRVLSMESAKNVKQEGGENDLVDRIKKEKAFAPIHARLGEILDAKRFIGRAEKQVEELIDGEIEPLLSAHSDELDLRGNVKC
ncbi:MAG: adenylosuccinate lyase [Clostridiales bacterium]|jgi:adenylosuccinate lyase|nr:adenylosuccinate lyase [Clostridiales bacterium]